MKRIQNLRIDYSGKSLDTNKIIKIQLKSSKNGLKKPNARIFSNLTP